MQNVSKKAYLIFLALGLAACGGGSGNSQTSNTNGVNPMPSSVSVNQSAQLRTPSSSHINFEASGNAEIVANTTNTSCFTLVAGSDGKTYNTTQNSAQYYSTATLSFTIKNTCSTPEPASALSIVLSNFLINGSAAPVNWIGQSSGNPYLTVDYSTSGQNLTITTNTPDCSGSYCDWALMPAGATRTFTVNTSVSDVINSFGVDNVQITNGSPTHPALPGILSVQVDATSLASLCDGSTECNIGVNVFAPTGNLLDKIWINPYQTKVSTKQYTNLLIGNYTLSVDTSSFPNNQGGKISYIYSPANGVVPVNSHQTSNSSVTFAYAATQAIGNLRINVGTIPEAATFANMGTLSGIITNLSTQVKTAFTANLNGSATLNNIPAGTYLVQVQGFADPATGVYYSPWSGNVTIAGNITTTANVEFSKNTTSQYSVDFTVSGTPGAQIVGYAADNYGYKYNANLLKNGTNKYKFLSSVPAVALTINQPSGYTLAYSPVVVTPSTPSVTITYTQTQASTGSLTTFNDQILDSKGNVVKLKGINWFGFNNGDMLNGLWNWDPIAGDFAATVWRLKALGFNAVRLPFSFSDINGPIENNYTHKGIPPASASMLQTNLTNPSYTTVGKVFPTLAYNPTQSSSNQLLPNDSTLDRFMWTIDFFARNGFYVLIDDHLREDQTIVNNGQDAWVANWKALAQKIYTSMPAASANRVMFDLLNEPEQFNILWTSGPGTLRLDNAYLAAMDAINSVTNGQNLFLIEGTGQGGINANWGDGFATDKTVIGNSGLSDPNNFFTKLATKPYVNQVVLSPHVYPPSVTNATADYTGSGLYNRLSTSFGYLAKTGYCVSDKCHRYPVAFGEFGSTFTDSRDLAFFQSFANYLNNTGDATDGKHDAIDNWFYWSYNPNSGDTGGIVANDWIAVEWMKIDYLSNGVISGKTTNNPNGLGLVPWYK